MTIEFKKEQIEESSNFLDFLKDAYATASNYHIFLPKKCVTLPGRYHKTFRWLAGQKVSGIIIKNEKMGHKNFAGHTPPLAALHMLLELAMIKPFASLDAGLSWPDEVVVQHKAIASLYTEAIFEQNKAVGLIAIVTLNINNTYAFSNESYHTSTSHYAINKKEADEEIAANEFLTHFQELYRLWEDKQYPHIYQMWKEKQRYLDDTITFYQNIGMVMRGQILDFKANGDMLMHDENGKNHTVNYLQVQEIQTRK